MSQAVQDLLWVVNSPSFVHGENVATMKPITAAEIDADELRAFLDAQGGVHRVGRYFEQLVHYWLVQVRRVELVHAGLQIRDGKRTIGELDFVYRDELGQVVHCEVSVKFFLHHPRDGTSHFPGPNASDNFELKTTKLFDQQLELSRIHYPSVERRDAIVKGMVFYRSDPPVALPVRMNPAHATGAWLRASELGELAERNPPIACAIAEKPYWLAPQVDGPVLPLEDGLTLMRSHFDGDAAHPLMVSLRDPSSNVEVQRVFVVSEHWPSRRDPNCER